MTEWKGLQWDYRVEITNNMTMGDLEDIGKDGWELAGFQEPHAFFKRPNHSAIMEEELWQMFAECGND